MAHEGTSSISSNAIITALTPSSEDINPWASARDTSQEPSASEPEGTLIVSHLETMPTPTPPADRFTPPPELPKPDSSVMNEFDPLASDPVEKDAREAWANAEGHLPPSLPVKVQETPQAVPPPSSVPQSAPAIISSFPSLASLARTLNLSPKRSSTPPLPPPPRSSSLRHAHTSSLPSISSNPAAPTPPPKSSTPDHFKDEQVTPPSVSPVPSVRVISSPAGSEGNFDFQKFLDQMKMKGAEPIGSYLRSFLSNFSKKTFTVKDQIKIIHDFLDFIADKMRTMEGSPWQNATLQEFDNSMEAMEKIVMNRLYEFTFQPLLPPTLRTTDDIERDHVLRQRILLFGWLREEHLDVPKGGDGSNGKEIKGFLDFAQHELLKINHYKAPRDKLICILNCCKVIFGLIRHVKLAEGADSFIPILIYVVLKANPDHLVSNIEYINRFRRPEKLQSEAGYYLSSLMGAVSFIETMDHTSLSNITQEEFESYVEAAIDTLPETRTPSPPPTTPRTPKTPSTLPGRALSSPLAGEEPAEPLSLPIPSASRAPGASATSPQLSLTGDTRKFFQRTSDTISKPLTAIGRIFSEVLDDGPFGPHKDREADRVGWRNLPGPFAPLSVGDTQQMPSNPQWSQYPGTLSQVPHTPINDASFQTPIQTPYKPRIRPTYSNSPSGSFLSGADHTPTHYGHPPNSQPMQLPSPSPMSIAPHNQLRASPSPHPSRNPTPTLDFAALQDEVERAHSAAQDAACETLMQIFPSVDKEVAEMVLEANDGDLGKSIEQLLEISGGGTDG